MAATPTPDALDALDLLPTLLGESAALREKLEDRFSELIDLVFDELEDTLATGSSKDRGDVMKMILPLIVRVKKENETTGEDVEAARTELQNVLAEMGQGLGAVEEVGEIVEPTGSTI